jgi:hypothetical protein
VLPSDVTDIHNSYEDRCEHEVLELLWKLADLEKAIERRLTERRPHRLGTQTT